MKGTVTYERRGALGLIALGSANGLNVLDRATREALSARVEEARSDADAGRIRGLGLVSAGSRAFCAGADLREVRALTPETALAFAREGQAMTGALAALPVPTAAIVDAPAFGGGIELALACDFRYATPRAGFLYQAARFGILPGWGGTQRLPRVAGLAIARRMLLLGEPLDAAGAVACNLAEAAAGAESALAAFEAAVAPLAPASVAGIKAGLAAVPPEAFEAEARAFAACFETGDAASRIAAFLSRKPAGEAAGVVSSTSPTA